MCRVLCVLVFSLILCVSTSHGKYGDCGRVIPGEQLITGGVTSKLGETPWHAGIYRIRGPYIRQICGGSLITHVIVISAAHCFWDDGVLPPYYFQVAVGKIYRPWHDCHDMYAQKSNVDKIYIPHDYHGSVSNDQQDIAVLRVSSPFQYNLYVRPICVSFDENLESQQLIETNSGKVAGWGWTENNKASPVLRVADLNYVSASRCFEESPLDFKSYITIDKFCAGAKNGTTVCKGDSGGGLAFAVRDKNGLRYYLRGLASTAPTSDIIDGCNGFAYAAFTQISKHQNFVAQYLSLDTPSTEYAECGISTPELVSTVAFSGSATIGITPWHAIIYNKFIDGAINNYFGTIITSKFIISGGNWGLVDVTPQKLVVAVGKIYVRLEDDRDQKYSQKFDVSKVHWGPGMTIINKVSLYRIVLLELVSEIEFTKHVRPICLNFDQTVLSTQQESNYKGKVAVWENSRQMGAADWSPIAHDTCYSRIPEPWQQQIGSNNETISCVQNVPRTDDDICTIQRGGGFAAPITSNNGSITKYYLQGVFLLPLTLNSKISNDCSTSTYLLISNLYKYKDFIEKVLSES